MSCDFYFLPLHICFYFQLSHRSSLRPTSLSCFSSCYPIVFFSFISSPSWAFISLASLVCWCCLLPFMSYIHHHLSYQCPALSSSDRLIYNGIRWKGRVLNPSQATFLSYFSSLCPFSLSCLLLLLLLMTCTQSEVSLRLRLESSTSSPP